MIYISRSRFFEDLSESLTFLKEEGFKESIDIIFCIMKGGLMIGQYFAYKFEKPLYVVECNKKMSKIETTFNFKRDAKKYRNILVVDEILDTGKTLGLVNRELSKLSLKNGANWYKWNITNFCLYCRDTPFEERNKLYKKACKYSDVYCGKNVYSKQWLRFFWDRFNNKKRLEEVHIVD